MDDVGPDNSVDELPRFPSDRFEDITWFDGGNNAAIFRAYDRVLRRDVALKIGVVDAIAHELGADDTLSSEGLVGDTTGEGRAESDLLREARMLARVRHPNVIPILDVGRLPTGATALVMPLLGSGSLASRSMHGAWQDVLDVVLGIGEGLTAIHDAGLLHRDLKPANVLFDALGWPYIADLGLACELADAEQDWSGTPAYMSPEALAERSRDRRDDIYAFCMVAFEMFYGHSPFSSTVDRHLGHVAEIERREGMDARVREILVRGLCPEPDERWSTVDELLGALRAARAVQVTGRRRPRYRWLTAGAAALGLVAGAVGLLLNTGTAEADSCEQVADELGEFWAADVQLELRVILGTRNATDVLQSWAHRWVDVRAQECKAFEDQDRAVQRSPCSANLRNLFTTTVITLRTPLLREGLDYPELLAQLPAPEHCLEHPDDADYGLVGILDLRRLDLAVGGLLASAQYDGARVVQQEYMDAARQISSQYDIARAIYWRAELLRLTGELVEAARDFKRVYAATQLLGAVEMQAEAMMKLVAVAGAMGKPELADTWAFVSEAAFLVRSPDRVAELRQVHGLALLGGDHDDQRRGIELLRDAVEMRRAQRSRYGGDNELISRAMESQARGLLRVNRLDEALEVTKQSLALHEADYDGLTKRARELSRLTVELLVALHRLHEAYEFGQDRLLDALFLDREYVSFIEESLWLAQIYSDAGLLVHADKVLQVAARIADEQELSQWARQIDARIQAIDNDGGPL
jgi:tRNA A-37 threonylcarbamoyl transferase component Bud32/tetratricopeptide (TPR) repeat protein